VVWVRVLIKESRVERTARRMKEPMRVAIKISVMVKPSWEKRRVMVRGGID